MCNWGKNLNMKKYIITILIIFSLIRPLAQTRIYEFDSTKIKKVDIEIFYKEKVILTKENISPPEVYDVEYSNAMIKYNIENGFPDQFCYEICQDKNGMLWIGSDREGVNSFNGKNFNKISKKDGLSSLHVKKLISDSEGRVWVGSYGGVDIIENGKIKTFKEKKGEIKERVRALCEIEPNKILASFQYTGLFLIEIDNENIIYTQILKPDKFISNIILVENKIFFSIGSELMQLEFTNENSQSVKTIKTFEAPVTVLYFDDLFYIGTEKGLSITDIKGNNEKRFLTNTYITCLQKYIKNSNQLLIGTYYNGIYSCKIENSKISSFKTNDEVGTVHSFFKDKNEQLWIGTGGKGLIKIFNDQFKKIKINSNETISVKSKDELIYFCTDNGFAILKNNQIIDYSKSLKKHSNIVWDIDYDKKQNIFYFSSSGGGFYFLDNNSISKFSNLNEIINQNTGSFLLNNNSIFIGSYDGLFIIENDTIYGYKNDKPYFNGLIENIISWRNEIYVITDVNILKYKDKEFYDMSDAFNINKSNEIIYIDSSNIFVLGDGLTWMNRRNNEIKYYTENDGLGSNFLNAIDIQNESTYWIGSNNGVSKIEIINGKELVINTYDFYDGFMGYGTNQNGALIKNEKIYWGTLNGLIVQDLSKKSNTSKKPKVFVEKIISDFKNEIFIKNNFYKIELDYKFKYLSFYISTIDLLNYTKVRYSYFLEGFSDEWSKWSENEEITFSSLPVDKKLTLRIKCIDSKGIESDEFLLNIYVQPPFWKTKWFMSICIISLLILIFFFY
jgi:ligand-binding sensor domain-containing protein